MSKITAENVTKIFGKNAEKGLQLLKEGLGKEEILRRAGLTVGVNRASFSVEQGEIFVIMGLSGSGKSTMVRMLNRLISPTSGCIRIDDEDITTMSPKRLRSFRREKISMVFQRFALFPHRTIMQNVVYGLEIQEMDKTMRERKAQESLEMVGLKEWANAYPDQLSGGMQQRVGLARALANDPDILLMDEAFSALDPLIRKDMQDELLELQENVKKTIVFITHDLGEALRIGDRIALMKDGEIVQIGTPEEIMINPANEYVERFVEDVDLSKVLTASHVMKRPALITLDKGPRVALQMMREQGVSTLYAVDKKRQLLGVITAEDASQAARDNQLLEEIINRDVPRIPPDMLLNQLFDMVAFSQTPPAVVDEDGRLRGIIVRGAVLGALSGKMNGQPAEGGE